MLNKRTQSIIIKAALICSVSGAGYYVGAQTDTQNSIAYARSLYMTTQSTSMRTGMSSSKSKVATIPSEQAVDVIAVFEDGAWAKVKWNGNTGYVHTMYLRLTKVSDSASKTSSSAGSSKTTLKSSSPVNGRSLKSDGYHMYATEALTLRKIASTSGAKLATVKAKSDLLIIDKSGSFYKVLYNGRYGWVTAAYVKDYSSGGSTGTSPKTSANGSPTKPKTGVSSPGVQSDGYHMLTKTSVNLRAGASQTSKKLGTLPSGTDVLIIDRSGSYYKVLSNGRYGYIYTKYLIDHTNSSKSPSQGSVSSSPASQSSGSQSSGATNQGQSTRSDGYHMYAKKQTVLRKGPSVSSAVKTTIAAATDLLIIDQDGAWYKVYYNKAYSWVKKAELADYSKTATGGSNTGNSGATRPSTGQDSYRPVSIMTTKKSVKLLAGPNKDFNSRGQLPSGTEVTVLDDWGYYVKVSYNGKDGYIHMDDLKKAKGYQSPGKSGSTSSGSNQGSGTTGSGVGSTDQKPGNGIKSDALKIKAMNSYGNTAIKVSGTLSTTRASKVNVYLNGTFLNKASTDGASFSYTIPSTVTLPGSNKVRIEATTPLGTLYQEETFTVNKIPTIIVDPGHGGLDSGAVGVHNGVQYLEKNYDIKFATNLKNELIALGFNVKMTRTTDKHVENSDRVAITRQHDADLLFALHHNAASASASGGLTIYPSMKYNPSTQASFTESKKLAQMLANAYQSAGMSYRGSYQDINISGHTLYIMRNAETRTILTEMGFITNSSDIKKITSTAFQADLPRRMAKEIYNFFYRR